MLCQKPALGQNCIKIISDTSNSLAMLLRIQNLFSNHLKRKDFDIQLFFTLHARSVSVNNN